VKTKAIIIVMYYMVSASAVVMEARTGEIALLKSRGAGLFQVVLMMGAELGVLGIVAVLSAPLAGLLVAQGIARNEATLLSVLKAALGRLERCECGGELRNTTCCGCLRNYRNQFCHDELERGMLIDFPKGLNHRAQPIPDSVQRITCQRCPRQT